MKFVAFDTETALFVPGNLCPALVCASFCGEDLRPELLTDKNAIKEKLQALLESDCTFAGARISYDFGIVLNEFPDLTRAVFAAYDNGRVWDVQIAASLHAIAFGNLGLHPETGERLRTKDGKITDRYSLETCVKIYLNRADAKENSAWRLRYAILGRVPLEQWPVDANQYPLDDARNTLEVALAQHDLPNAYQCPVQTACDFALHLSALWGMRTEKTALDALEARILERLEIERAFFTREGFFREDGTKSKKAIQDRVAAAYANPPTSAKGGISTDRDTLSESGDPLLERFARVSELEKLIQTYVPAVRQGETVPINPKPNVLVASGRTSYGGVLQTLPRGHNVRDCFIPRPGFLFCSVDYGALELCTLAQCQLWISGSSALAEAINAGADTHALFACKMIGVEYADFMRRLKSGDKQAKGYRQAAKAANFGFPGGMGPLKLVLAQRKIGIRFCVVLEGATCGERKITEHRGLPCPPVCARCVELATSLRDQWFAQWPEMRGFFEYVKRATQGGEIEQFCSNRVRGGVGFCDGANTLFQGLAADGAKAALWEVTRRAYAEPDSILYNNLRVSVFVHDEILSEIRESHAHDVAEEKARIMREEMRKFTPDIKITAEPALCRRWYKEAETVYDQAGKLIPWEPKK